MDCALTEQVEATWALTSRRASLLDAWQAAESPQVHSDTSKQASNVARGFALRAPTRSWFVLPCMTA